MCCPPTNQHHRELIPDLLSTVERAEKLSRDHANELAAKKTLELAAYVEFHFYLPCWHPAKPSLEESCRFYDLTPEVLREQ